MNTPKQYTSDRHRMDATRIFHVLSISAFIVIVVVTAFQLLQRIGIPPSLLLKLSMTALLISLVCLSWMGRTMVRNQFFFAGRMAKTSSIGISAISDWISGAFLILFFSAPLLGKLILAPAIMFGLLLQAILFSLMFHRSGALTLPGFFSWRMRGQKTALVGLLFVSIVLALLIVAEFSVTRDMVTLLTGFEAKTVMIIVIAITILPSLTGGWLSLLIINGVFAVGILLCVLLPSSIVGFLPGVLQSGLELEFSTTLLPTLYVETDHILGLADGRHNALAVLTTLLVLSAGFSVLPHALSRGAINAREIGATESLGWTALFAFLMFSALPLSIGLIGANPTSPELAGLLKGNPVLHMLPYLALLMAAANALATTIFALSSVLVRSTRRSRNLDPGEQSMFAVRLLVIALAVSLYYLPKNGVPLPGHLFVSGLSLGAAAMFLPLLAAIWFRPLPRVTLALSMIGGSAVVIAHALEAPIIQEFTVTGAGAIGIGVSGTIIFLGWLLTLVVKTKTEDPRLMQLRTPNMDG